MTSYVFCHSPLTCIDTIRSFSLRSRQARTARISAIGLSTGLAQAAGSLTSSAALRASGARIQLWVPDVVPRVPHGNADGMPPNPYGGKSYSHPGMMEGPLLARCDPARRAWSVRHEG